MDSTVLVEMNYEEGKKLIQKLDEQGIKFPIALWINLSEGNDWVLMFGVPRLDATGSKDIYKKVQHAILTNSINISLSRITLLDSASPFCQTLRTGIRTGPGISKVSFFGNFINGQRFPDSIIYRVI